MCQYISDEEMTDRNAYTCTGQHKEENLDTS
jgi:hypothetical protein